MLIVGSMNVSPTTTAARVAAAMRQAQGHQLRDAALILADAGVPVFPCAPGDKNPVTPNGFHDASTDVRQVARWWLRTPDANVAIPTGAPSGLVVVDVDVHPSGSGFAGFARAERAGLAAAWSSLVRTPSGGLHAYYTAHGDGQRSWQVPGAHIDFRGDGGYVVVPPSRVRGRGPYSLIAVAQHEPKPLDSDRLRTFLSPPRPTPRSAGMPAIGTRPDRLAAFVASRPEGERNGGLFWAACRMAEDGQRYDVSLSVLGDAARAAGLGEREVETTIRSAYRISTRLGPGSRLGPTTPRTPMPTSEAVGL